MAEHLYVDLWEKYLPAINSLMDNNGGEYQLSADEFRQRGNREHYSFRLSFYNCMIPFKGDSAVARDLKRALDANPAFLKKAAGKNVVIRLDQDFVLHITVS